jgi:hypothetical protein
LPGYIYSPVLLLFCCHCCCCCCCCCRRTSLQSRPRWVCLIGMTRHNWISNRSLPGSALCICRLLCCSCVHSHSSHPTAGKLASGFTSNRFCRQQKAALTHHVHSSNDLPMMVLVGCIVTLCRRPLHVPSARMHQFQTLPSERQCNGNGNAGCNASFQQTCVMRCSRCAVWGLTWNCKSARSFHSYTCFYSRSSPLTSSGAMQSVMQASSMRHEVLPCCTFR